MSGPGADELRVRQLLIKQGVGPDATPADAPPKRPVRERDWLDDILDEPAVRPAGETKPKPRKAKDPDEETEPDTDDSEEEQEDAKPPAWDPVAVADRIAAAYRERPAGERLKHAAEVVVHSRARFGQLIYTATGVLAAWRIGLTPWLLHHTADAPIGVPVGILGIGWLVNRRLDPGPLLIAWTGRAIYTATVINLVLHP